MLSYGVFVRFSCAASFSGQRCSAPSPAGSRNCVAQPIHDFGETYSFLRIRCQAEASEAWQAVRRSRSYLSGNERRPKEARTGIVTLISPMRIEV
jgi:hypothetical protein